MFSIEVARKAGEDVGVGVLLCVCEIGAIVESVHYRAILSLDGKG